MRPTSLRRLTASRCSETGRRACAGSDGAVCWPPAVVRRRRLPRRGSSRSAQVLYTVKSGNLVETASGRATLTSTKKGKVTATVQVMGTEASQVAAGQSVTVVFVKLRPAAEAAPVAGRAAPRLREADRAARRGRVTGGSAGLLRRLGRPGLLRPRRQGGFGGKTATATVTGVQAGSNGAVKATISIAKLPSGVTTKYTGIARSRSRCWPRTC